MAVVEVRREGREEAEEWRELAEEAVSVKCFFFFWRLYCFFKLCVNSDAAWSYWRA